MIKQFLIITLITSSLYTTPVLADDTSDRKKYIKVIEKQLKSTAKYLNKAVGDKGSKSVQSAIKEADKINGFISKLSKVTGGDADAEEMVEEYPDDFKAFKKSALALASLKQSHHTLDAIPEACKEREDKLEDTIKDVLSEEDSSAIKTLPKKYKKVGSKLRKTFDGAESRDRNVQKAHRIAKSFKPETKGWEVIQRILVSAANKVEDHWTDTYKDSLKECKNLLLGEKHPDIKKAVAELEDLHDDELSEVDKLEKDTEDWLDDAKNVARLDCQAMDNLWEAYCGLDYEPNTKPNKTAARAVGKKLTNTMRAKIKPVQDRQEALLETAQKLLSDPDTKEGAQSAIKILNGQTDRLSKLSNKSKGWRGSNHPLTQYSMEYGKQQHTKMENSHGCDLKDVTFPGIGAKKGEKHPRPDCVNFSKCEIIEFKPDNKRAIAKGKKQLARYKKATSQLYDAHIIEDSDGDYVFDEKIDKKKYMTKEAVACIQTGKMVLSLDGAEYKMCEKRYECHD